MSYRYVLLCLCAACVWLTIGQGTLCAIPGGPGGDNEALTPLLLYFRSNDCSDCKSMDTLFAEDALKSRIEDHYVAACLNIDDTDGQLCAEIYAVSTVPSLVIADREGNVLFRSDTPLTADDLDRIIDAGGDTGVSYSAFQSKGPFQPVVAVSLKDLPLAFQDNDIQCPMPQLASIPALRARHVEVTHLMSNRASQTVEKTNVINKEPPVARPINQSVKTLVSLNEDKRADPETPVMSHPLPSETTKKVSGQQWHYAVQLGYFTAETNANKLVLKATQSGIAELYTQTETHNGKQYFRVLSGSFNSLRSARDQLNVVLSAGLNAAIYRW